MNESLRMIGYAAAGTLALAVIGFVLGPSKNASVPKDGPHSRMRGGPRGEMEEIGDEEGMMQNFGSQQEMEAEFQKLMTELNEAVNSRNNELAEKKAENLKKFARAFGEKSINYGFVLGIPLASYYEAKGDMKALEKTLKEAVDILIVHGMEYVTDTAIIDKLISLYLGKGDYTHAEKYSIVLAGYRKKQLKEKKSPDTIDKYGIAANRAGLVLSNLGKFKDSEATFVDVIKVFQENQPASIIACQSLEYYSNMLHQQGRTKDAIIALKNYVKKFTQPDPRKTKSQIMRRIATLSFTIDDFTESINFLKQVLQEQLDPSTEINCLIEIANSYWEVGNEEEAKKIHADIKTKAPQVNSLAGSRSKYLCTQELIAEENSYTLQMRVNRDLPRRKEGEPLEDTSQMKRKLDSCFLSISYETAEGEETIGMQVDTPHEFLFKTKPSSLEPGKWYEVNIVIYKNRGDFDKKQSIGSHHQLVWVPVAQRYRVDPGRTARLANALK